MGRYIELFKSNTEEDYLSSALEVTKWIDAFSVEKQKGKAWRLSSGEGSSEGDELAVKLNDRSIYSGAAGIGFYYVQLYEITGDKKYLDEAVLAGEYLLDTFTEELGESRESIQDSQVKDILQNCCIKKLGICNSGNTQLRQQIRYTKEESKTKKVFTGMQSAIIWAMEVRFVIGYTYMKLQAIRSTLTMQSRELTTLSH